MNLEFFIAKRIIDSKAYKSSISAPIIKIGILAIILGMIVMLIAIATGIGLQKKIREKVVAFEGHAVIERYDNNNSQESQNPITTEQGFYPKFSAVPEVTHIQATATKSGIIRLEDDFEYVVLKGVGKDYDWQYFEEFLVEGKLPDFPKEKWNDQILISEYLANRLQFKVGDKFNTYFLKEDTSRPPNIVTFEIVGIYNSGLKEFDQLYVVGDITHIQRLNKWDNNQVGRFEVFVKDFDQLETTGNAIREEVPTLLNAVTVDQMHPVIFEWISIFDKNTYAIIGIMILVAGINMITALLVLILERTQMIGILKALGSSNLSIRKIFLYNATYLIIKGLFWGNLIGISLLLIQKYFGLFPLDPKTYYVSTVPIYFNIGYIIALNIGTFVLCLLMLIIPSVIVSKISPVKAIRFE